MCRRLVGPATDSFAALQRWFYEFMRNVAPYIDINLG
jgi:hypothetical protein